MLHFVAAREGRKATHSRKEQVRAVSFHRHFEDLTSRPPLHTQASAHSSNPRKHKPRPAQSPYIILDPPHTGSGASGTTHLTRLPGNIPTILLALTTSPLPLGCKLEKPIFYSTCISILPSQGAHPPPTPSAPPLWQTYTYSSTQSGCPPYQGVLPQPSRHTYTPYNSSWIWYRKADRSWE